MKKRILTMIAAAVMTLTMSITAFAHTGVWQQDGTGWWWQRQNGNYPTNQWVWIDGNADNIVECYYFGPDGYMLANTTTPDGYTVDANGAWTVNGVVQSRAMQPLTDDNYIPGQDTSGAVTDPSTVEKITFNESLLAYKRTSDGVATFPTALENSRDNYNGLMTEYTTIYNNNPLTVYVLKSIGQITAYFGNASHFVNNIPEAGIEVNAFFENSGFEDPYGDAGGHVHGSTGNLDRVFNIPASKLRILEIKYDNGKMHHLWIQLTQGTDGNWYVYPDSPAYLG